MSSQCSLILSIAYQQQATAILLISNVGLLLAIYLVNRCSCDLWLNAIYIFI